MQKDGHQIYLGLRDSKVVIRAQAYNTLLEFVEKKVLGTGKNSDVPAPLVHDCVHWLNLTTGHVEFRRQPDIWKYNRPGNWVLDVHTKRVSRREVCLVDPHSNIFRRIARIFEHFEDSEMLTVFQPSRLNLTVELKRMDLEFRVNGKGLLQSKQLGAEVDPDQDAGTWYGLRSKIVLRDFRNSLHRSIIVPLGLGPLNYKRQDPHVAVLITNHGRYGRYTIDNVLGRVQCASEPLLQFTKAQLHAYTSFVLPDPLTGRTGAEEALSCLSSASNQPWTVLDDPRLKELLLDISRLTPSRLYYPKHLHRQQIVSWNPKLTVTIQHDGYRSVVQAIFDKLERLAYFSTSRLQLPKLDTVDGLHLRQRSYSRRRCYERPETIPSEQTPTNDHLHRGRGTVKWKSARSHVSETIHLLCTQPACIHTTPKLAELLQNAPSIRGYNQSFSKATLSSLLETDIRLEWGPLVNLCRSGGRQMHRDHLLFQLGVMAFGCNVDMDLLRAVIAFFVVDDLRVLDFPPHSAYTDFQINQEPTLDYLLSLLRPCCAPYVPNSQPECKPFNDPTREEYEGRCDKDCHDLALILLRQWPCPEPIVEDFSRMTVDMTRARDTIRPGWLRLFQNWEFSQHLKEAQKVLDRCQAERNNAEPTVSPAGLTRWSAPQRGAVVPTVSNDLLRKHGPSPSEIPRLSLGRTPSFQMETREQKASSGHAPIKELKHLVGAMANSPNPFRKQYAEDLISSLVALEKRPGSEGLPQQDLPISDITERITEARKIIASQYQAICDAFSVGDTRRSWLYAGGLWPSLAPVTLLEQLRTTAHYYFGPHMKEALLLYGISLTRLQYLLRIYDAKRKQDIRRLQEELRNPGHGSWQPHDYPDWLLLEIDSNILIRDDQVNVARATIFPGSGLNSVLQMNMGQGKTSVIMPMVACVLANSKSLTRLIVPRALLLQTAQILQSRLGGLVGREIRHIPFSRKTSTTIDTIKTYELLHEELRYRSGIVLTLPEHVLSFKLGGLQCLSDGRLEPARAMVALQSWLDKVSRDVIDESDFTLAVKTQLIYPSGSQLAVDGHPHRWKVAQILLKLVETHLLDLQQRFPHSIEVVPRTTGGFPFIHFLRQDVENALHQDLVDDIYRGRTSILPIAAPDSQQAIRSFLLDTTVDIAVSDCASMAYATQPAAAKILFLLRGLFVHGVLLRCLKRRWNVQYGLHPQRDPIAVPFHAKGVPSDQAEWGHPDVAILLTCLSFYYSGLTLAQLRQSLQRIFQSDDPPSEYDHWTHASATLPEQLRHWSMINVDDDGQVQELWHHLRFIVVVINDYLNHFVFPLHARQFFQKLQASGWDIPLSSLDQKLVSGDTPKKAYPSRPLTTGFSGTNDNRRLLPLTIRQEDLLGLSHTNAEVLTYLLHERNRSYELAAGPDGKRLSETQFLARLRNMKIRLLIDAGAHILDLDNKDLVQKWLDIDHEASAAVFFDSDNRARVLYRNGKVMPLLASPFIDNLENCLVYLDEAHTRGTDLKFPVAARGVLTLSLGQTKDHTVQAAMRLRQLGTSQSIVFMASPEVHQSILHHRGKSPDGRIDAADVVSWLLEQTCRNNEQLQHLYLAQGHDFCHRMEAVLMYPNFLSDLGDRAACLQMLLRPEQQSLEEMYKPRQESELTGTILCGQGKVQQFWAELKRLQETLKDSDRATHSSSAFEEVEQEREVSFEIDIVRQVEQPKHFSGLTFPGLHPGLLHFVEKGELLGSDWYEPAFAALKRTSVGQKHGICGARPSQLLVSKEFTRTVESDENRWHDDFLRPVHWILWSPIAQKALAIIPEEAEALISEMRGLKSPGAYLLVYAAPVSRRMLQFDSLKFYSIPRLEGDLPIELRVDLGIFAGRLYFEFSDYDAIVHHVRGENLLSSIGRSQARNPMSGSVSESHTLREKNEPLADNPVGFLEEWFSLTRKGQDFNHTPMGYVCQGRPLRKDHPFFIDRTALASMLNQSSSASTSNRLTMVEHDENDGGDSGGATDESEESEVEFYDTVEF